MLKRLFPDKFIVILIATIFVASFLPVRGEGMRIAGHVSNAAIFSLFFFHGLRLPRQAVKDGLKNWRLQLAVLAMSFAALPFFGLTLFNAAPQMLTEDLWQGVLFLCVLPSTVQAAIASASMARGNVAASVIAAAFSNLSAVILTPVLIAAVAHVSGSGIDPTTIGRIMLLLLLPFALGQLIRPLLKNWAAKRGRALALLDRATILITVYVTFSAAVNEGLWQRIDAPEIARLSIVICVLLALAFTSSWILGGLLRLPREDRITLLFSGAHKSLATGAPMARILFPAAQAGMIVIPLMIYHQLQLILSAWIASRLARSRAEAHIPAQEGTLT